MDAHETNATNLIQFKAIPGYEGLYSATSDGRIYRHCRKRVKPGFVNLRTNTEYIRIALWKDGIVTFHHVHRLVASTFIPNPMGKPQVNHKNLNKHDNRVENLEWVTRKENWEHARQYGLYDYIGNMLSEEEKYKLYELYCTKKFTRQQLAKKFNISLSSVHRHIKKIASIVNEARK